MNDPDRAPLLPPATEPESKEPTPPSWSELPKKDQLAILTLVRLAEPITQTSMHAYMFAMIRWFDETLSDGDVAAKAGLLAASFEAAQAVTGVMWGNFADKACVGRKKILLIGISESFASIVGFGFSKTFYWALFYRCVGGAMNGNVSVMRTMVSEIVDDKRYQTKAFLLMPVTFNIGIIVGPLLGGLLGNPVAQYPSVFGPGSPFGGKNVVSWLRQYPYALPNVVMAVFTFLTAVLAFFGLAETHKERKHKTDVGVRIWQAMRRAFFRLSSDHQSSNPYAYAILEGTSTSDTQNFAFENSTCEHGRHTSVTQNTTTKRLPFRRIFTRNVVLTILTHFLLATHVGSFNTLWFLFLSAPRNEHPQSSPGLAGGLGLPSASTGIGISIIGILGLTLQFGIFSSLTHRLGILPTFRAAGLVFPVVYVLAPLLALLPMNRSPPGFPAGGGGAWLWIGMVGVLFLQVAARTFALPLMQVLTNNCSPHPSVLGSLHGVASSVSSGAFSIGPIISSWLFGRGLGMGFVALAWWVLAVESLGVQVTSRLIYEGDGHEIKMEGEEDILDDDDDENRRGYNNRND